MAALDLESAAQRAEAAADLARLEITPRFRNVDTETKADGSPVTEADRAAERAIRAYLERESPEIPVLGEEYGGDRNLEGLRWLVDPIDGTIAYSRGIPTYTTLIALLEDGEPVLGLIDLPPLGERLVGWKGGGCRRNGTPVRASQESDPTKALVAHGDGWCFERTGRQAGFLRMAKELPAFRGYADAFGHALTIYGGVDAMVDTFLNPWDAAATRILIAEAGGACHIIDETDATLGLVFGSPALCEHLLELLEG